MTFSLGLASKQTSRKPLELQRFPSVTKLENCLLTSLCTKQWNEGNEDELQTGHHFLNKVSFLSCQFMVDVIVGFANWDIYKYNLSTAGQVFIFPLNVQHVIYDSCNDLDGSGSKQSTYDLPANQLEANWYPSVFIIKQAGAQNRCCCCPTAEVGETRAAQLWKTKPLWTRRSWRLFLLPPEPSIVSTSLYPPPLSPLLSVCSFLSLLSSFTSYTAPRPPPLFFSPSSATLVNVCLHIRSVWCVIVVVLE